MKVLNRYINPEFKAGFFTNDEKDMFIDNWVEVIEESWGQDLKADGTAFCSGGGITSIAKSALFHNQIIIKLPLTLSLI